MRTVDVNPGDYAQDYLEAREETQKESTVEGKRVTIRNFTEYCNGNYETLDMDDQYASLDVIRDFFDNGSITVSSTRLSHLRDFIEFIENRTTSLTT